MATPQITLRVTKETLQEWKEACDKEKTNVSQMLRELMNKFVGERNE
jgi:hypothetical protein